MQSDRTEGLEMIQILRELEHVEVHFHNREGGTTGSPSGKVHFRLKYMLPKQINMKIGGKKIKLLSPWNGKIKNWRNLDVIKI